MWTSKYRPGRIRESDALFCLVVMHCEAVLNLIFKQARSGYEASRQIKRPFAPRLYKDESNSFIKSCYCHFFFFFFSCQTNTFTDNGKDSLLPIYKINRKYSLVSSTIWLSNFAPSFSTSLFFLLETIVYSNKFVLPYMFSLPKVRFQWANFSEKNNSFVSLNFQFISLSVFSLF